MDHVWYAGYGSNLAWSRFRHYLRGGIPEGATRTFPGARDPSDPAAMQPVQLTGSVYFAWESPTWGGGIAFYDPERAGTTFGRAYLVTADQLADVATQEMHRAPTGDPLDLVRLVADGRLVMGPGRYETLHVVGEIDHVPVVTFTSSVHDEMELNAPRPAYLTMMARGLAEAHHLDAEQIVDYVFGRPGCRPGWTREDVCQVVRRALDPP
jgi:hypothetical protein